ncbi:MAG TPA: contractile injection system tape measure protein [Chthoniobacterales bacterium]|nr:contractile injection system tape measure protein [Chthoniobacterales bacterium]
MLSLSHRIRRQRWAFRAGSEAAAFALRQQLRGDWQSALLPAFEEVFDHEVPGTDVVHISKIELNLSVGPEEKVSARWSALIHEQLLRQLRETLQARPGGREKAGGWKKSTAEQNRFQNLLHYLHSGFVTWEAAAIPAPELAAELEETCRERWRDVLKFLQTTPAPSLEFCFRLLHLLPAAEASAAARAILEALSPWETPLVEILATLLATEQKRFSRYEQLQLAAHLLSETLAARRDNIVPDLARIARRAVPFKSEALDHFIASLPAAGATTSAPISKKEIAAAKEIASQTEHASAAVSRGSSAIPQKKESPDAARRFPPVEAEALDPSIGSKLAPAGTVPASKSKTRDAATKEIGRRAGRLGPAPSLEIPGAFRPPSLFESATGVDFSLLAAHAGLILLHPFLPRFFESTGLKEETNVELAPFGLPRGAALLHYLATGRDAIYEYDLLFIKVLLGMEPETPLCVSEGLITEADRQETEALLQSAITHWTALRNTSITGFRSSFLDRPALLRKEDNGWRLQVERQPFDVLLEHLPWSISVVKLPWMEQPIHTEW